MGAECLHVGGDSGKLVLTLSSASWHDCSGGLVVGGGRLALVGGRVVDETLLDLAVLSGEEDELCLVLVESIDVQLELLLTGGGASVVD